MVTEINTHFLKIIEWDNTFLATMSMVDQVHNLPPGTTENNFNTMFKTFKRNLDYYIVPKRALTRMGIKSNKYLLTASGYLKLTDDKDIQGEMFNYYFSGRPKNCKIITDDYYSWYKDICIVLDKEDVLEKSRLLRIGYGAIQNTFEFDLNYYGKVYSEKTGRSQSAMETIYWLEHNEAIMPVGTLKNALLKIIEEEKEDVVII